MSAIFGALNINDTDRVFQSTVGQEVIYDEAAKFIAKANDEMNKSMEAFVEGTTDKYKTRYKLPGGGYLQHRNSDGSYSAVKASGAWDVAYPMIDVGAMISGNDVDMAYMTVAELDSHIQTIVMKNVNTTRYELLKALFNNTADTFVDDLHGSLTIQPLANGDSVVYPPVSGSASEATENHYLESGYAASAIADAHNPYVTIRDELLEHFGESPNVAVFINSAEEPETEDLTDFDAVNDAYTRPGANTAQLFDIPVNLPGTIIGRTNGVWVVKWNWIPAGWALGIDLDATKPLMKRVDPADTGLPEGLNLVATDERFPFKNAIWRNRFGFGCGNRLNGVVMEFGTAGTYTVPTAYA